MEYIDIQEVMDNVMMHPMLEDVTQDRILKYAIEFLKIVGIPNSFEEKVETIKVENYRASLPCDFYDMIQVKDTKTQICYRYTTDSFHLEHHKPDGPEYTYKIQGNIIYTSFKDRDITISYRAMKVNEDGFPMIYGEPAYVRALELYIKLQCFTILFDMGKLPLPVLQNLQQEYAWAVGQAQSSLVIPSFDRMESIANMWTTLVQRTTEHSRGFKSLGQKEFIRRH